MEPGPRSDCPSSLTSGSSARPPGGRTLSTAEAAAALGVTERTVRRLVARGELAATRRGTAYRIDPAELDRVALPAAPVPRPLAPPLSAATSFVGRQAEIARLTAALLEPEARLVTLTGPGGVGKTRLALAVADAVRAAFPDGVVVVPLAAVADPAGCVPAVGDALGLREIAGVERDDQVRAYLRDRRLLLVLDNLEQLPAAFPAVGALAAAAPRAVLLATSRTRLRLAGERVLVLPPMALPDPGADPDRLLAADAGALFVARARAHDPAFALDAAIAASVAEICARLDGLPLAIELAAARVRVLPPADLRRQLSRRLPLLTTGPRDAPARHATLRDAIAWSHDLLPPDQRRAFARLSVFVGGFDLAAAAAVVGPPARPGALPPAVVDLVEALLDQSLLARDSLAGGPARFHMLETIREFGLEQLDPEEEADARAAHARHFAGLAESLRPLANTRGAPAPLARLAADDANLRSALAWLADHGTAADLAAMVAACQTFLFAASHFREAGEWLDRSLAAAEDDMPAGLRARLLVGRAELCLVAGRFPEAEALFAEAVPRLRGDEGDPAEPADLALALVSRGAALVYGGDPAAGEAHLAEAAALAERIPDPVLRAAVASRALANLAVAARALGDPALAADRAEAALRHARSHGLDLAVTRVILDQADIAADRGDHRLAVARYLAAIDRDGPLAEQRAVADVLDGVASAAVVWGRPRTALRLLGAARALRQGLGFGMLLPLDVARRERDLVALRAALGPAEAEALLRDGRDLPLADAVALAAEVRPAVDPLASLTRREREILALLAESLTDREIADRLSLSSRTVSWHVGAILGKLGVGSRRQALALARGRGAEAPRQGDAPPPGSGTPAPPGR